MSQVMDGDGLDMMIGARFAASSGTSDRLFHVPDKGAARSTFGHL
jgi:hypothetical protein